MNILSKGALSFDSYQTKMLTISIQGGTSLKHLSQSQRDRIVGELESCGGNMPRSMIARRTKLKQTELDSIFEELEREGIIKRTRLRTDHIGPPRELISLKV